MNGLKRFIFLCVCDLHGGSFGVRISIVEVLSLLRLAIFAGLGWESEFSIVAVAVIGYALALVLLPGVGGLAQSGLCWVGKPSAKPVADLDRCSWIYYTWLRLYITMVYHNSYKVAKSITWR